MLTQILFAVVMMFSAVATMFSAVAAAAPDPAAPVLYVYSVGSIAKTTVILDGQELAKIKGYQIFGVKITRGATSVRTTQRRKDARTAYLQLRR